MAETTVRKFDDSSQFVVGTEGRISNHITAELINAGCRPLRLIIG